MLDTDKILFLTILAVIFLGVGVGLLMLTGGNREKGNGEVITWSQEEETSEKALKKTKRTEVNEAGGDYFGGDLLLPFTISDIDEQNGEVNPLGVVRFSKDMAEYGHSGIDIPLKQGAPIYSVADGSIVLVKSAGDPWGGQGIFQLLQPGKSGEGIAFIYEHVTPVAGIKNGSKVMAGDLIATKTPPTGFTAHFQLSYVFNNYEFIKGMECWVDFLDKSSSDKLSAWWKEYRGSAHLIDSWRTTKQEEQFVFRGLLDKTKFPDGLQFCYPLGTDVR